MNEVALTLHVRFKSKLTFDEVMKIAEAYQAEGEPRVEVYKVLKTLREDLD